MNKRMNLPHCLFFRGGGGVLPTLRVDVKLTTQGGRVHQVHTKKNCCLFFSVGKKCERTSKAHNVKTHIFWQKFIEKNENVH